MWGSDYTVVPSRMGSIVESIGIDGDTRVFRIHSYESLTESGEMANEMEGVGYWCMIVMFIYWQQMNTESSKDLGLEINIIKSVITCICSWLIL